MDSTETNDLRVQNETCSDEFVLHARFPSLQEIAYNQIAIAVWYGYSSTSNQRHNVPFSDESGAKLELQDCHKLIKSLAMPRFMVEMLKKYLKRVRKEIIRCNEYFRQELFSINLYYEYAIPRVDRECVVWRPDGRIDYKSTAINMVHSQALNEVQKFAIMSRFCLENEIKTFNLNQYLMKAFIENVNDEYDPVLFYWICYLKNKLQEIKPCIRLFDRMHMHHWEALEYFWNRLSAEDQVSFLSSKLCILDFSHSHHRLFLEMSHDRLTNLLFSRPVDMILLFIKKIEMPEWAIVAWKRCKNWISKEQFVELLQSLLDKFDVKLFHHQEDKMSVLLEIWNTANDHLKNYAAGPAGYRLDEACVGVILSANSLQIYSTSDADIRYWKKVAPSGFKFLLKFLSLKSSNYRKNLLLKGDPAFIYNFDFNVVHEIFELCLPFQGEVEFKNRWLEYVIDPYFCNILYSEEDHDELNRRLLYSVRNLNISSNDLKKLAESLIIANKRKFQSYHFFTHNVKCDLIRLSKFINKILQKNFSAVLKMKESYISSFDADSDPYERYGSLSELRKLIEQEFVYEHLRELKRRLAVKLQSTNVKQWVWYVIRYEKFACVFSWCFENEEEMFLQLKRSIPINDIIFNVFEEIVRESTPYCFAIPPFNNLQRFLEWYFSGVAKDVVSFKLGIMNDPEATKILENVQIHDKRLHRMFSVWIGNPNDLHMLKEVGLTMTLLNLP